MECNLGWNHMRDFKIERAPSASSTWNHKYDFRPKLHSTQFNYHFITSTLPAIWLATLHEIWNLFACTILAFLFNWLGKKCMLEQKCCNLGINHTAESQSDCMNHQRFQSGCNKINNINLYRMFHDNFWQCVVPEEGSVGKSDNAGQESNCDYNYVKKY